MGFSGGTDIAQALISSIQRNVEKRSVRRKIYRDLIRVLEDADWDNQDEALGIDHSFDRVLRETHPEIDS